MNGVSVWVCKAEPEMCVKCGRFYGIGAGQWGTVQCGGNQGIQGHYIEISVQASKLQFAEVEIIGAGNMFTFHSWLFSSKKQLPRVSQTNAIFFVNSA